MRLLSGEEVQSAPQLDQRPGTDPAPGSCWLRCADCRLIHRRDTLAARAPSAARVRRGRNVRREEPWEPYRWARVSVDQAPETWRPPSLRASPATAGRDTISAGCRARVRRSGELGPPRGVPRARPGLRLGLRSEETVKVPDDDPPIPPRGSARGWSPSRPDVSRARRDPALRRHLGPRIRPQPSFGVVGRARHNDRCDRAHLLEAERDGDEDRSAAGRAGVDREANRVSAADRRVHTRRRGSE